MHSRILHEIFSPLECYRWNLIVTLKLLRFTIQISRTWRAESSYDKQMKIEGKADFRLYRDATVQSKKEYETRN